MPKRRESRIYWRKQGGERRAYGDFRDLGGGREALIPMGQTRATTDPDVAAQLASERVKELETRKRNRVLLGVERDAPLAPFVQEHLVAKAKAGKVSPGWLRETQKRLTAAADFFGQDRELSSIAVRDVEAYTVHLQTMHNGRGGALTPGTQRHYLNALSNLFRRAQAQGAVPPGYNPVAAVMEKPSAARREAHWLEVHDAALLLEAARVYRPEPPHDVHPHLHALLATFLLTGGRQKEVLGLRAEDVSFDRGTITFRPNGHRRLKTKTSHRTVPLVPQLREILQAELFAQERVTGLLFPAYERRKAGGSNASTENGSGHGHTEEEQANRPKPTNRMIHDLRKALDGVGEVAGFEAGEIRTKVFRHTFCAAALQLLDRGAPISPWTVARWMGHGGQSLVNRVYGHLGDIRHRSEVLEFRADQHRKALGKRLTAVRKWTPPRCRHRDRKGEQCGVRGNLSADGRCLWHDPARKEKARRARPHAHK